MRHDDPLDADIVVRPMLDMNHVLCASAGYLQAHGVPIAPEDLSRHRMVRLRTRAFLEFVVRHVQDVAAMAAAQPLPAQATSSGHNGGQARIVNAETNSAGGGDGRKAGASRLGS